MNWNFRKIRNELKSNGFFVFEDTMKEAGYNLALEYENQMLFLVP